MAGYFIANFTIHDAEKFTEYWQNTPFLKDFGARPLVIQRNPEVLKGEPNQIVVVIEFESVEAVKNWYESPEYQAALDLWVASVDGWSVIGSEVMGHDQLNLTE